MRYKVPQNIDMQDRVIGPLTMTQFVYVIIGTGLSYSVWTALPSPIGLGIAIPLLLLTFCIGFIKINERPFWVFLASILGYMSTPRQRVWQHDANGSMRVEIYTPIKSQVTAAPTKNISHEEISRIAQMNDRR
ncbi:MAG: PrgI family protein [Candidatus Berkelbacteria bacterium]